MSCFKRLVLVPLSKLLSCGRLNVYEDPKHEYLTVTSCKKFMKTYNKQTQKKEFVEIEGETCKNVKLVPIDFDLSKIKVLSNQDLSDYRYLFNYRKDVYLYDKSKNAYKQLQLDVHQSFKEIQTNSCGLNETDHKVLFELFGSCAMSIESLPFYISLVKDSFNFFYMLIIFTLILWYFDDGYKYATLIVIMMTLSLYGEFRDISENVKRIQTMAHYECPVKIKRRNNSGQTVYKDSLSGELVPGDVFVIPEKVPFPCDAVIISGEAIVNEAMLTGESSASNKVEIPNDNTMLTGFSVINSSQIKHFCFSGTTVIKTFSTNGDEVEAIAVNTGYSSIKGSLVKSILYPAPERFAFNYELKLYCLILLIFSLICVGVVLPTFIKYFGVDEIIYAILEALSFSVPPELPVAMNVGVIFALQKLREKHISCINVSRINVSGRVSVMVFDKTGTLTENCISVSKLKVIDSNSGVPCLVSNSRTGFTKSTLDPNIWNDEDTYIKNKDNLVLKYFECLASCHSLVSLDGQLLGDPLEIEMFKTTNWEFCEELHDEVQKKVSVFSPRGCNYKLHQIQYFSFAAELQWMSVIAQSNYYSSPCIFTKGSPEKIYSACVKETLPQDYFKVLEKYTRSGKRVIAFAYKELDDFDSNSQRRVNRDELECRLNFLGFLVLSNKLKPETIPSIVKLKKGNVTSMMATGDNLLTGIYVAHKCGILTTDHYITIDEDKESKEIFCKTHHFDKETTNNDDISNTASCIDDDDEYQSLSHHRNASNSTAHRSLAYIMDNSHDESQIAISGKTFEYLVEARNEQKTIDGHRACDILSKVIYSGRVYARMSPDHKGMLIKELQQETGEMIGMCGDGANDCQALKVADAGLSLSEAEASIAAPFTSNIDNISSAVDLLRLGRFSLDYSYCLIKYLIINSAIEFTETIILNLNTLTISDAQYVCIDILCLFPVGAILCFIDPISELPSYYPSNSILSFDVLASIIGHLLITIFGTIGVFFCLKGQGFYDNFPKGSELESESQEGTTFFIFTLPLYIFIGIVFYSTSKFKKSLFQFRFDYICIICYVVLQIGIVYWIVLGPLPFMKHALDLVSLDFYFRVIIASWTFCMFFVYLLYETALVKILTMFKNK